MKVSKIVLGPSIIQTFLSCRQKFLYSLFKPEAPQFELDPINSPSDWGTIFHKLCADRDRSLPFTPSGFPLVDKRFHEYIKHTEEDSFTITGVEVPLLRQLSDVVWMGGTADKLIDPATILDYKTTRAVTEIGGVGHRDGDQLIHYLWASGMESGWGIIDLISQSKLENNAKGIKFLRLIKEITPEDVADWKLRMEAVTTEMVRTIEAQDGFLFKNKKTCTDFFQLCPYKQECDAKMHTVDSRSLTNDHFSITLEN